MLGVAAANIHIKLRKSACGRCVVATCSSLTVLIFEEALSFIKNSHKQFMLMNCTTCTAKLPFSPRASTYLFRSSICLINCCWDCIAANRLDKEVHTNRGITAWEAWEHPGNDSELLCHSTMWKQKNCVFYNLECGNFHISHYLFSVFFWYKNNLTRDSDLYTVNTVNNTMWTICWVKADLFFCVPYAIAWCAPPHKCTYT